MQNTAKHTASNTQAYTPYPANGAPATPKQSAAMVHVWGRYSTQNAAKLLAAHLRNTHPNYVWACAPGAHGYVITYWLKPSLAKAVASFFAYARRHAKAQAAGYKAPKVAKPRKRKPGKKAKA